MKKILSHNYDDIICLDNLFLAWREFVSGKRYKKDVQEFSRNLFDNILSLHEDLVNGSYRHGGYESFFVNDPKRRHIHKASVRDRLLHHAVHRILYPFFDRKFIADSFSCRLDKGTHRAINRFRAMAYQVSENHTRTCWVLKCDIRKFFASIDHNILIEILEKNIEDKKIIWLLDDIIGSFRTIGLTMSNGHRKSNSGLPLGNLTSQLFANVYMNEFDQWVKHRFRKKYYIRYADDYIFLSDNRDCLRRLILVIEEFLQKRLKLFLHPKKIFIKTIASGVDFLGWINFGDYRILRKPTVKRAFRKIRTHPAKETLQSYFGLLKHGNAENVKKELTMAYWAE